MPLPQPVAAYLAGVLQDLAAPLDPAVPLGAGSTATPAVVDAVLQLLGGRRFTHLSRTQALPYLARMRPLLQADVDAGRPLRFCYDLGPGYHASVRADFKGLQFSPGLGELLALRQIHAFARAVAAVYAPGVRFGLVIDDLCAWVTNDVAPVYTAGYVQQLEALVAAVGLQERVGVLAESALLHAGDYRQAFERLPQRPWTAVVSLAEQENVSRFVGRACSPSQAAVHLARHRRALAVSEQLLAPLLAGVRLTQRASADCLGFRCFPGSDVRLQSGAVDLLLVEGAQPRPGLVTQRNQALYQRWPLQQAQLPPNWPLQPGAVHAAVAHLQQTVDGVGSPAGACVSDENGPQVDMTQPQAVVPSEPGDWA